MAQAKVFVLSGSQVGEEVSFTEDLVIGRSDQAGLSLSDHTVSRSHARLCIRGGRWLLVDLKSSNGTRVEGKQVTRAELVGGEEFQVGEVKLRFQAPAQPPAQPPTEQAPEKEATGPADWGDEIDLEEDDQPPAPAPSPTTPAAPPRRPAPAPAGPAGPGKMRRLGGQGQVATQEAPTSDRGGLMGDDMGQWSGLGRLLGILFALAICGGVAYLCFLMATGF